MASSSTILGRSRPSSVTGYVCDEEGIKVLDVTDPSHPRPAGKLELEDAHNIYLARTYAYVAAGKSGLVILDIEKADHPRVDQVFNAGGCINDVKDVKLGITYVSEYAYLADGKNGLRVVQLTSPETPGNDGFSPRPTPELIATFPIPKGGEALAISKGLDRDRASMRAGTRFPSSAGLEPAPSTSSSSESSTGEKELPNPGGSATTPATRSTARLDASSNEDSSDG